MSLPDVVSREQWLEARRQLLAREKEYTRARDALNADRRRLPMVTIDQEYVFEGPDGPVTLADLFGGKRQLIVQHVMFGPDWEQPCPGCSAALDELSQGVLDHLGTRDTTFVLTARAPYDKIAAKAKERGWSLPLVLQLRQRLQLRLRRHPGRRPRPGRLQLPSRPRGARRRAVHRTPRLQLLPARGRRDLPHLLDLRPGHRHPRQRLLPARPDRPRPPGGLGRAQGPGRSRPRRRPDVHQLTPFRNTPDGSIRYPDRVSRIPRPGL